MEVISYSNIGRRDANEDYILTQELGQDASLHIVADGMGGYQGGEIAAELATTTIAEAIASGYSIGEAARKANQRIDTERKTLGMSKMGCTVAGVHISGDKAQVFWCGDSRVYLFRDGKEVFMTEDHSLLNEIKKKRRLTTDLVEKYGSVVVKAVMGDENDTFDIKELDVHDGDELIVCSDGLHRDCPVECLPEMIHTKTMEYKNRNEEFNDNHSFVYIKL